MNKFEFVEEERMVMFVKDNVIILKRFCGEEIFPIKEAQWSMLDDDGRFLWIDLECEKAIKNCEDTDILNAKPSLDISFTNKNKNVEQLAKGLILEETDDEAMFYYCEHQLITECKLEILDIKKESLLLHITGKTVDVNYYDGSKPDTHIALTAWFINRNSK